MGLSTMDFDYKLPNFLVDIKNKEATKKALEGERQSKDRVTVSKYPDIGVTNIRGILTPENFKSEDEILFFQFNPTQISDLKDVEWSTKSYTGFNSNDYYWVKGGERSITFNLFFDATAGSNTRYFHKTANYGDNSYDTLDEIYPKGVASITEKLTAFQYPQLYESNAISSAAIDGRYQNGNAIPSQRFLPPPILIFVYGNLYIRCILSNAQIRYTLFNEKLIPTRAEADVTLKVIETDIISVEEKLASIIDKQRNANFDALKKNKTSIPNYSFE